MKQVMVMHDSGGHGRERGAVPLVSGRRAGQSASRGRSDASARTEARSFHGRETSPVAQSPRTCYGRAIMEDRPLATAERGPALAAAGDGSALAGVRRFFRMFDGEND